MRTQQEKLWAGSFGQSYTKRQDINDTDTYAFFAKALQSVNYGDIDSVIEFGANEGHNLTALRALLGTEWRRNHDVTLDGVEINKKVCETLRVNADHTFCDSVLDFHNERQTWDLVVTKGLLIHIAPDDLLEAYDVIYESAHRYILVAEYFAPEPTRVHYRNQEHALWKRDFGSHMLDRFPRMWCVDYGFAWSRDEHPQDNITWWLFEKGRG